MVTVKLDEDTISNEFLPPFVCWRGRGSNEKGAHLRHLFTGPGMIRCAWKCETIYVSIVATPQFPRWGPVG